MASFAIENACRKLLLYELEDYIAKTGCDFIGLCDHVQEMDGRKKLALFVLLEKCDHLAALCSPTHDGPVM